MSSYSKVIYLDADLSINYDISNLCFIDMQNYPIAATTEVFINSFIKTCDQGQYFKEILGFKNENDISTYFQAGVLLLDVAKFSEYSDTALEMATKYTYTILDQDILNKLFKDNYYNFGIEWNFAPIQHHNKKLNYIELIPPPIKQRYLSVIKPKIIHYADRGKPWLDPTQDMADLWWYYARGTPFYELLIYRMQQDQIINNILNDKHIIIDAIRSYYRKYKLKYFIYKLLFNKTKATKYLNKYREYKNKYITLKLT